MADQSKAPVPKITYVKNSNVVAKVKFGCTINLKELFEAGHKFATYDSKKSKFAEVVTLYRPGTSTTGRIFSSGKMMCLGAVTDEGARMAARKFASVVRKKGFPEVKLQKFQIYNVQGKWNLPFRIDLEPLMQEFGKKHCEQKGGRVHFFTYKMKEPKISFNIFEKGTVTFMGAKTDRHVFETCEKIYPILEKYKKK